MHNAVLAAEPRIFIQEDLGGRSEGPSVPEFGARTSKGGASIVTRRTTFTCWFVLRQVLNFRIHNEMATTLTTVRKIDS